MNRIVEKLNNTCDESNTRCGSYSFPVKWLQATERFLPIDMQVFRDTVKYRSRHEGGFITDVR